jgi:hypothetical protein
LKGIFKVTEKEKSKLDLSEVLSTIVVLVLVGIAAFAYVVNDRSHPVISYGNTADFKIEDRAPGEWIETSIPLVKHRDCSIMPSSKGPIIYVQGGAAVDGVEWSRNGPLLAAMPSVWQLGEIKFLLPDYIQPGPAAFVFEASFRCTFGAISHRSPAIEFTILEKPASQ